MRVGQAYGASLHTAHANRPSLEAPRMNLATGPGADQVTFSRDAVVMNRLVRTWGALSFLFGMGGQQQPVVPDFSALREALREAQRNLAAMQSRQKVVDTLQSSALRQAELLVEKYYGLQGDGTPVRVKFEESMEGALASVSFRYDRQGRTADPTLHLNLSQFLPDAGPNGVNQHVIENDRIIAHEMTHLIMGRNMDMRSLPDWFAEGTAEYISGGAERVSLALRQLSPRQLLGRLAQPWEGDTTQYAAAYLVVRYMDHVTAPGGGLKAVMSHLKEGQSLDRALQQTAGGRYTNTRAFLEAFVYGGEGLAFMNSIDLSGRDPGSIKPGAGHAIVADQGARSSQPLRGFRIQWPSPLEGLPSFGFGFTPATQVHAAYRSHMPHETARLR